VILSDETILQDLFSEDAPKKTIFALYGVVMLMMSYHALVYFVVDAEKIIARNDVQEYSVDFLENTSISSESRVVVDGEPETLEFTADENLYTIVNAPSSMRDGVEDKWYPHIEIKESLFKGLDIGMALLVSAFLLIAYLQWQTNAIFELAVRRVNGEW